MTMRDSFQLPSSGAAQERFSFRKLALRELRDRLQGFFLSGLFLVVAGCSQSGVPAPPKFSPSSAASQALAEYDTNKDGALDAKELEQCPALLSALKKIDKNNDGRLSADEIAARLTYFQREGMLTSVTVEVTLDGRPLPDATVTLMPEKFLGTSFKPALGTTDAAGTAVPMGEGSSQDLISLGYYRIEVSKKDGKGRETIPAKYNSKTTLGREIAPPSDGRGGGGALVLRLTSK